MPRCLIVASTMVAFASMPAAAQQARPADAQNPLLSEELAGQAGETPPISLSRLAAGVRHYPAKIIRSLLVLGEHPLVLRQVADNPELIGDPDRIAPPIADHLKAVIRDLAATPALIAVAAAHPAEMKLLRQVYAEAPDGVEQRIVELRASFAHARLEAAAAWQRALENDPAALGEYRKLLTAFSREQQRKFENFPYVHVTKRTYYYAAPPNEAIIMYAEQRRGEMNSLWRVLTNYWTAHRPEEMDGRALLRNKQPAAPIGDDVIAAAAPETRAEMWKPINGKVPESVGFMPVIMQPLADQPPEARYAFAIADHARLWTSPAAAIAQQPVQDERRADARRPAEEVYDADAGTDVVEVYVEVEQVYEPRPRYYDPYDYYGASVSYRYYYSSVFPYYYGYPYYSPIYAGAFPYYGGYYHLHDGHHYGGHDAVIGRIGRGRFQLALSFGGDHRDDRNHRGFGTRFSERTLYPRAFHEPRDHASRAIRPNDRTIQRRNSDTGRSASSLLSPSVLRGSSNRSRSSRSGERLIQRRTASTPTPATRFGRSDGSSNADRVLAGQNERTTIGRSRSGNSRFGAGRSSSGSTRSAPAVTPRRSVTRAPIGSRSTRDVFGRSTAAGRSSGGISRLRSRGTTSRSTSSGIRRNTIRTPTRTIGRTPSTSVRRSSSTPTRRSTASRSTSSSRSRSPSINRSRVSRSSAGASRSTRSIGRRSTGRTSPRGRP